jgi:hypothetical protein
MAQELVSAKSGHPEARTLIPRDDKIRLISVEVRRNIEDLISIHQAFEKKWFSDEPPDFEGGRGVITELLDGIIRARNSTLELGRMARP